MPDANQREHRAILRRIAREAMVSRGLIPDFPREVLLELPGLRESAPSSDGSIRDLSDLAWCSIDNDTSRDLDQLTVAELLPDGAVIVRVAVADVDSLVGRHSAVDRHARHNTTSVYTPAEIFPMLPERLSTDLTSLNYAADRRAVIVEMVIHTDGALRDASIYLARVHNRAKLAYNSVGAWLEGTGPTPPGVDTVPGLADNLRLQDRVATRLKALRHAQGALDLETVQARPVFDGDRLQSLEPDRRNPAHDIIENFMVAANGVVARYLAARGFPSLRRVVRTPKRWDRIVDLAAERNVALPPDPDPRALEAFLVAARNADPAGFPDLSLSIIKLLGAGEYVLQRPGNLAAGHFGLAVKDYTHSTAPNRRYPDLVTQRLIKTALTGKSAPYPPEELESIAAHCTLQEDAAKKVERQVQKSAAALLLEGSIGDRFDAIVTGAADKGTWVRLFQPPIEGKLVSGFEGMDVGYRIRVELVHTDPERGHIDFRRVG